MEPEKIFSILGTLTGVFHGLVAVFLAAGIIGHIFLGKNSPKWLVRLMLLLFVTQWTGIIIFHECPITVFQKYCDRMAGESVYAEGFLDHYIHLPVGNRLIEIFAGISIGIILLTIILKSQKKKLISKTLKSKTF